MAENLSGVPPAVSLSGLDAGAGGFSGASQQGLGGSSAYGQTPFGMTGGMDLNSLMQLLGGGETAGVGTGGDIGQSLTQGSLGQQQGGFGAGAFGQTQPGYTAGQSASGSTGAAGAGSADPFALIQKTLGLAQKGASALGASNTASPTSGSDLSLNGPLFQPEGGAGQVGTSSPTIAQDMQGGLMGTSGLQDPTLNSLFTTGALNGWDGSQQSLEAMMAGDPALKAALFGGEVGGSLGETMSAPGGSAGFTLGTGGEGGATDWSGAAQGGLGGASGLLGILQGIQSGNATQGVGGLGQTLGGLQGLIQSSPELAKALGLEGTSALGQIGGGIGLLTSLLGFLQKADSSKGPGAGDASNFINNMLLQTASQLGTAAPQGLLTGATGDIAGLAAAALPMLTGAVGQQAGLDAKGQLVANATAQAVANVGAALINPAGWAGAAATLPVVGVQTADTFDLIGKMERQADDAKRLMGQEFPSVISNLQKAPDLYSEAMNPATTNERVQELLTQSQGILQSYNNIDHIFKKGPTIHIPDKGDKSIFTTAQTQDLQRMQKEQFAPLLQQLAALNIHGADRLGIAPVVGSASTPQDLAAFFGTDQFVTDYRDLPSAITAGTKSGYDINGQYLDGYNGMDWSTGTGHERVESDQAYQDQVAPLRALAASDPTRFRETMGPLAVTQLAGNNFNWAPEQQAAIGAFKPGGFAEGLRQLYGESGSNNPYLFQSQQMMPQSTQGFAQPTQGIDPTIMAQAMSPQASTNGAAQGMMTEETLMDLLRRMQMGGM